MKITPTTRMQRPLALLVSLSAALLATSTWAQDQQVYGQIRLTINQITTGPTKLTELRDNASRFGIRGSEKIGDLSALYGFEYGFNADTGSFASTTNAFRYSYVGLRGDFGTLALGRLDSANPTGSPLYSQVTAIVPFAPNDAGATAISTSMLNSRNRVSDAVGYQSPTWGGVNMRARYYHRGAGTATEFEDAAKSVDLGLNYSGGPIVAALGYGQDTRKGGLKANEFDDKWQVGLRYNIGMFSPYVMIGKDRYLNTATTRKNVGWWIVGAKASIGEHGFVLNVMERDVQTSLTAKRGRYQAAYLYNLSKRTELQLFYDNDQVDSSKTNVRVKALGFGVRHDF